MRLPVKMGERGQRASTPSNQKKSFQRQRTPRMFSNPPAIGCLHRYRARLCRRLVVSKQMLQRSTFHMFAAKAHALPTRFLAIPTVPSKDNAGAGLTNNCSRQLVNATRNSTAAGVYFHSGRSCPTHWGGDSSHAPRGYNSRQHRRRA